MIVKELIKRLKKMPQDVKVVWRDHDQSEWEYNNDVNGVEYKDAVEDCSDKDWYLAYATPGQTYYYITSHQPGDVLDMSKVPPKEKYVVLYP